MTAHHSRTKAHRDRVEQFLLSTLGPMITNALARDDVVEVYRNADGKLWIESNTTGRKWSGDVMSEDHAMMVIKGVATETEQSINRDNPSISALLPALGQRFHAVIPPQSPGGPVFNIRKRATRIIPLSEYIATRMLDSDTYKALYDAVLSRANILVVGGTGTGKTTFLNSLLKVVGDQTPSDRCIILEDTPELTYAGDDAVYMVSSSVRPLRHLVQDCLRMRPDRIIVGESRGGEALEMLTGWGTGHPGGMASIHADSAEKGLGRLERLILQAVPSVDRHWIAETINVIVHIAGKGPARRIEGVLRVEGIRGDAYITAPLASR